MCIHIPREFRGVVGIVGIVGIIGIVAQAQGLADSTASVLAMP